MTCLAYQHVLVVLACKQDQLWLHRAMLTRSIVCWPVLCVVHPMFWEWIICYNWIITYTVYLLSFLIKSYFNIKELKCKNRRNCVLHWQTLAALYRTLISRRVAYRQFIQYIINHEEFENIFIVEWIDVDSESIFIQWLLMY